MIAAAAWQRLTGPTHPRRGHAEIAGRDVRWRLLRTWTSGEPFMVAIPAPEGTSGTVRFRRFPTDEAFQTVEMTRQGPTLVGLLPTQPPAGKLEYYVLVRSGGGETRIPGAEAVVMRFKGEVPALVLVPHVTIMFVAMMIGVRAALAALLRRKEAARYAWVALVGISLGGMILGPVVQKYAFGAFWTGWPLGSDLTDNKTAVMWLAWILAVFVLARRPAPEDRGGRAAVVAAALVMIAVYLVPHSLRGSQLDYRSLDAGRTGPGAVSTGR